MADEDKKKPAFPIGRTPKNESAPEGSETKQLQDSDLNVKPADEQEKIRDEQKDPESEGGEKAEENIEEAKENLGEGAPEAVFGKHGSRDENDPISNPSELDSLTQGAEVQSDLSRQAAESQEAIQDLETTLDVDAEENQGLSQYSSHPIMRFSIGRFQFEGGVLTLEPKDAEEFEKLMSTADARTQNSVQRVNTDRGDELARRFLNTTRVRGIDTAGVGHLNDLNRL